MIAKSDLIILVVASAALVVGIYRWQYNVHSVNSVTIPANSRVRVSTPPVTPPNPTKTLDAANSLNSPGTANVAATNAELTPNIETTEIVVAAEATAEYGVHNVVSGDFLGKIADRYGTSVGELQSLNGIRGTTILVGQQLRYPLPAN